MGFNFEFRQASLERDITKVVDFIYKLHLGYPNYDDWVQKAEAELFQGYKKAILALSDKKIVGDLIYQPHKNIQGVLEIKNLRVHEKLRKRDFGHFMLKQPESEVVLLREPSFINK